MRDPLLGGVKHGHHDGIDGDGVTCASGAPGESLVIDDREMLEVERCSQGLSGLEHHLWVERRRDGGDPTEVVGIAMRDDQSRERAGTAAPQEGKDDAASGVAAAAPRSGIDEDPVVARRSNGDRVALPHIDHVKHQLSSMIVTRPVSDRHECPATDGHAFEQLQTDAAPRGPFPDDPQRAQQQQTPREGKAEARGSNHVPARQGRGDDCGAVDGSEGEASTSSEGTADNEAGEHTGYRNSCERHGHEVGENAHRCH